MKIKYLQTPILNYDQITYDELLQETEDGVFTMDNGYDHAILHNGQLYHSSIGEMLYISQTLNTEVWKSDKFRRLENPPRYSFDIYVMNVNTREQVYP